MRLRRERRERSESKRAAEPTLNLGSTTSRPRDADRRTRRRLDPWDRSKYLILGTVLFGFFWWQKLNANPIKSVADGFWETIEQQTWVWVLLALEILRQLHFVVTEHWSGYYRFWKIKVFGRLENRQSLIDPWVRFRIGRVFRYLFWLLLLGVIIGQFTDQNPVAALIGVPGRIHSVLPWAVRLSFYMVIIVGQFVLLFWVPVPGRGGDLLPRRHRHPLRRRVGPGPRQGASAGEPDLPGEPRVHRGGRRLRPRRHPALRPSRHRQDAAGPRPLRARPASRSCSSSPARS